jgi:hypothetical protein
LADRVNGEKGVIRIFRVERRVPRFDASTTRLWNWAVAGAKDLRNNGLGILVLVSWGWAGSRKRDEKNI